MKNENGAIRNRISDFDKWRNYVEGLNLINDPKCNKVLNVINSYVANYSNYSNKRRIGVNMHRGAYSRNTVLRGITMVLSVALK